MKEFYRKIFLLIAIILFVFVISNTGKAQNVWYVSKSGDDLAGDGSMEDPFASIGRAVNEAIVNKGDIIKVAGGVYHETVTTSNNRGINLIGSYNPEDWTRDFINHRTIVDPGQENNGIMINFMEKGETILDGFTVRNAYRGFYRETFRSIRGITVKNCVAENCVYGSFVFCPISVNFENTIFRNCQKGIEVYQSGSIYIDNCLFYDISYRGFYAYNFPDPRYEVIVNQSTFYNCNRAIRIKELKTSGHIIRNNIFANCEKAVVYYNGDPTFITVTHNDFYNNAIDIEGAVDDSTNIYVDPEFTDPLNFNFRLQNSSPCIGVGTIDDILPYDLEGNPRPNPDWSDPDLGAFENPLAYPVTEIIVNIDIKPGSTINPINLTSKGNTPVAIFGEQNFDATTIDPIAVSLAEAPVKIKKNGRPMASIEDVNGDGILDMVVHITTSGLRLEDDATEATLEGKTTEGIYIKGIDSVRIIN